jgi:hypothetical protein
MTFDEARAAYPALSFGVYALEPGAGVTLEILTDDDQSFSFEAATLDEALLAAFPPAPTEPDPEPINVFD